MMRSSILLLLAAAVAAACGQLLFRVGAQNRTTFLQFANPQIIAGLLLYGLSTALWIYTLSREKLVLVYAFTVLTFVLVYLGSVMFLGETLSQRAILGVVLVLGGLYLLAA